MLMNNFVLCFDRKISNNWTQLLGCFGKLVLMNNFVLSFDRKISNNNFIGLSCMVVLES